MEAEEDIQGKVVFLLSAPQFHGDPTSCSPCMFKSISFINISVLLLKWYQTKYIVSHLVFFTARHILGIIALLFKNKCIFLFHKSTITYCTHSLSLNF